MDKEEKVLIVSIHDVSPIFLDRIRKIVSVLDSLQIRERTLAVIPNFVKKFNIARYKKFIEYLQSVDGEYCLHGLYHLRTPSGNEFTNSPETSDKLLTMAEEIFRKSFGFDAEGFIPPYWVVNRYFLRILSHHNFCYTNTANYLIDLKRNKKIFFLAGSFDYGDVRLNKLLFPLSINILKILIKSGLSLRIALHPKDLELRFQLVVKILKKLIEAGYESKNYLNYIKTFR